MNSDMSLQRSCDPREEVKICVGFFKRDVHIADMVNDILMGGPNTINAILASIMSFDSNVVEFKQTAQSNQVCTFYLRPSILGLGAGASHLSHIPIYCNIARRQVGLAGKSGAIDPFPASLMPFFPQGLGDYTLQYNAHLNSTYVFAPNADPTSATQYGINILMPLLKNLYIPVGTPIFKGIH
jgi:hypothetical protein